MRTSPVASLFINEYLPSATYKEFQNLKSLAKKLGFKYIWHRRGQILAKMHDGERVFTYSTPADLQAIAESYKNENMEAIKKLKNNNNKKGSKDKDAIWLDGIPTGKHVGRKSGLQAGFMNVNSLRVQIDQIRQFLSDNPSYDLLGIAETWLDSAVSDVVIRIPGYKVIRKDSNVNGGGVALFVREHLRCEVLANSGTERKRKPKLPEFVFCSVNDYKILLFLWQ